MNPDTVTSAPRSGSVNSRTSTNNSRGRGRNGQRGRGQDRSKQTTSNSTRTASNFKGHTTEMRGHVFECFSEGTKQGEFTKTVEALGEYNAKNVKNPGDMMSLTEKLVAPTIVRPPDIDNETATNIVSFTLWKEAFTVYSKRTNIIQQNMKEVFAVIWGQFSESLRDKVKSTSEYETKLIDGDCVWLLTKIKAIMLQFEDQTSLFISLSDANLSFASFHQSAEMTLTTYKTEYENRIHVIKHYGGSICEYRT
jgi:hypothetical protein